MKSWNKMNHEMYEGEIVKYAFSNPKVCFVFVFFLLLFFSPI